jgi:methionine aminopeptidase
MRAFLGIRDSAWSALEQAARILSETLQLVRRHLHPGISTLELDAVAEDYIRTRGAEPAFKGYVVDGRRYNHTLCVSIDSEVVHGIPQPSASCRRGRLSRSTAVCAKQDTTPMRRLR